MFGRPLNGGTGNIVVADNGVSLATPRRLGVKLAAIVGGLHLGIVLVLAARILVLALRPVAQWQLEWLTLERLDWPVSQFLWWHGWPRGPYEALPYPFQDPFWFLVPVFVFGVLGSAWYGLLAGAVGYAVERVVGRRCAR